MWPVFYYYKGKISMDILLLIYTVPFQQYHVHESLCIATVIRVKAYLVFGILSENIFLRNLSVKRFCIHRYALKDKWFWNCSQETIIFSMHKYFRLQQKSLRVFDTDRIFDENMPIICLMSIVLIELLVLLEIWKYI